mgnify:CR=1 FL=1
MRYQTALHPDIRLSRKLYLIQLIENFCYLAQLFKKSLNFTNSNAGGSGLKIQGTVYLYLPAGISITCQGANASGSAGAGAGIELSSGNTLYIIGGGTGTTVTATGGNAANGSNGGNGTWATALTTSP